MAGSEITCGDADDTINSFIHHYKRIYVALVLLDFRVGKSSAVNMTETLEYLEKSLKQNLAAALCIDSILLILEMVCGSYTLEAYSTAQL